MNKEIILTIGISGSGKSTWTTNFLKENKNYLRINRDDIRKTLVGSLDGYYQRKDLNNIEKKINYIEDALFEHIAELSKSVIVDNTNLKQKYITRWLNKANNWNSYSSELHDYPHILDWKFKLFDISLEEAKVNVICRENYLVKPLASLLYEENKGNVSYIDKQFEDYQNIKEWLLTNYKDNII